jgi:hypothetical protein
MNEVDEKLIEAAKAYHKANPPDRKFQTLSESVWHLMAGFHVSQQSSPPSGWVAIASADDLPKELAEYWWTANFGPNVCRLAFNPNSDDDVQMCLQLYSAWMRAEPEPAPYQVEDSTRPQEAKADGDE